MHKIVFDFYPSNSPEGENQIKNILKYCLKLPLTLGVNFRQYFKKCILLYTWWIKTNFLLIIFRYLTFTFRHVLKLLALTSFAFVIIFVYKYKNVAKSSCLFTIYHGLKAKANNFFIANKELLSNFCSLYTAVKGGELSDLSMII